MAGKPDWHSIRAVRYPRKDATVALSKPKKPKKFVPKEYDEQVQIFEHAETAAQQDDRWNLLFATLNGVRLPIGLAKKMKKAGNKQGVPDMFLPVPRLTANADGIRQGLVHWQPEVLGLWIELKRVEGGVVSEEQRWWHQQLTEMGYRVEVCKGAKAAIKAIEEYLK